MKSMNLFRLPLVAIAGLAAASIGLAAAPAWPADFWTQVSNHVDAVAPSGSQIATRAESVAVNFSVSGASDPYGTSEEPFSTEFPSSDESLWTLIDTTAVGTVILVK